MSKSEPQSAVYKISINQQQLDQIVAALKLNVETVSAQIDTNYDQTDVFFCATANTLELLEDLNRETPEDKARLHFGLCL